MDSTDAKKQLSTSRNARRIRSHQKSRAGCYTCKGRRVKCCETRPTCQNCNKAGLQCIYPESQPRAITVGLGRVQYQSRGFELRDMRYFHDFMTVSWPHLPLETNEVWLKEIPLLAQQHEFLMHAILALGASHIHARTGHGIQETVDKHRRLALKGILEVEKQRNLNENSDALATDLNAALGACYALTFTASYMRDPFVMFLILIRSCASFTVQLFASGYRSPFLITDDFGLSETPHLNVMKKRMVNVAPLSPVYVHQAQESLAAVAAYCKFVPIEQKVFDILQQTVDKIAMPYESYKAFVGLWTLFVEMSPEDFGHFTNPANTNSTILQAYFLAIEAIMRPWSAYELTDGRSIAEHRDPMATVKFVHKDIPDADKVNALLEWPAHVLDELSMNGARHFESPSPITNRSIEELDWTSTEGDTIDFSPMSGDKTYQ